MLFRPILRCAAICCCAALAAWTAEAPPPSTADAPPSYKLGSGDEVAIWALGAEEIGTHPFRIDLSGNIDVPLAGRIHAAGLTVDQLHAELVKQLHSQLKDPQVTVSVTELRSQPISVMGEVNKPGMYQLQGEKTLLEVLSLAEGVKADAGNKVRISRQVDEGELPVPGAALDPSGRFYVAEAGLRDALDHKSALSGLVMRPHDTITVEPGQTIYVMGDVNKQGAFAVGQREQISALQAMSLAGGPTVTAKLSKARILREKPDGTRVDVPINLDKVLDGEAENVRLKAGDFLYIPDSRTKNVALKAAQAALSIGTGIAIWR
ncbi:MAG TPA: polysaccharide biosynthesis/export family protein [Bryobacteraceae bacterium]|nr:polysaccharide biosynthesis/export family protein [Bryobacteraceae bacterium]